MSAGAIIGSVLFGLVAIALLTWLLLRMRRQRAAAAAAYAANPQGAYTQNQPPYAGPYPGQYDNNQQYNAQAPYPSPSQPGFPQPGFQGQAPGPHPMPANMSGAEREAWEAEQYAK